MSAAENVARLAEVQANGGPPLSTVDGEARPRWRTLAEIRDDADAMKLPEVVVPRLAWRGRATLFAAREKSGKSTLLAAAAAAVSHGREFFEEDTTVGTVQWVRLEEHVGDCARNLLHFGADADQVLVSDILVEPLEDIAAAAREHLPALIVVDTLPALGELYGVKDSGKAAEWLAILNPLVSVARNTDAALVVLHHANKATGQYRDSSGIGAAVDVIVEMTCDDAEHRRREVKCRGRSSMPVEPTWRFEWDGDTEFLLCGGSLPLELRLVKYVRGAPGCSKRAAYKAVGAGIGKGAALDAIDRLILAGELIDRGTPEHSKLYIPGVD